MVMATTMTFWYCFSGIAMMGYFISVAPFKSAQKPVFGDIIISPVNCSSGIYATDNYHTCLW